jgi:hypothetical protein
MGWEDFASELNGAGFRQCSRGGGGGAVTVMLIDGGIKTGTPNGVTPQSAKLT